VGVSAAWPQALEAGMLLCFAVSWPVAIVKMLRSKRAEGKSLGFVLLVLAGYVLGIGGKLADAALHQVAWPAVIWLYAFNCVTVAIDALLQLHFSAGRGRLSRDPAWPPRPRAS
jgi:hypothetical protein